jgi:2-hydroxychromene-2-carboxylate isomerase
MTTVNAGRAPDIWTDYGRDDKAFRNGSRHAANIDASDGAAMSHGTIDFWFTMGSTYSYLSVTRLPEVAQASGVTFRWRPFHLMVLLKEMKHVPFADKPAKSAYMWRDIARRAAMHGIPARLPAPYPTKNSELANLVAIVGMREGWGVAYVRAAYRRWFQEGDENGSPTNLAGSLAEVGQDATRVLALAQTEETRAALTAEIDTARALGLFGSPTFAVGQELFWGDDRLEDAIDWAREGRVRRR